MSGYFNRKTIKFLVPRDLLATKTYDSSGRDIIPLYINPQSLNVNESKIITENLTKGGYMVQYWGERIIEIQASGTTGSGGAEAIEILRDIYRYEQLRFKQLMLERVNEINNVSSTELLESSSDISFGDGLVSALDVLTNGTVSQLVDGVKGTVETIVDAFEGVNSNRKVRVELIPTIAAFAVSIDMYFQGERYRGFFTSFQRSETANELGHFTYTFNFKAIKKFGRRKNFMPWHRSPRGSDGEPIQSRLHWAGDAEGLTFPVVNTLSEFAKSNVLKSGVLSDSSKSLSVYVPTQESEEEDVNSVPINRSKSVKS